MAADGLGRGGRTLPRVAAHRHGRDGEEPAAGGLYLPLHGEARLSLSYPEQLRRPALAWHQPPAAAGEGLHLLPSSLSRSSRGRSSAGRRRGWIRRPELQRRREWTTSCCARGARRRGRPAAWGAWPVRPLIESPPSPTSGTRRRRLRSTEGRSPSPSPLPGDAGPVVNVYSGPRMPNSSPWPRPSPGITKSSSTCD